MCTSPFWKRVDNVCGCRWLQLPCGKCEECLRQKQSDYMVRIVEELKHAKSACMVTLTYSPSAVPTVIDSDTGEVLHSVCKNHVVNWIKRFRTWYSREYGKDSPLRYFLCAEYGPKTLRPHYHAIIINHSSRDFAHACYDWRKRFGYVTCKDLDLSDARSCVRAGRYVGKYCTKGVFENPYVSKGKVAKCFRLFSKRFGITYVYRMRGFHVGLILNTNMEKYNSHHRSDMFMDYILRNKCVYISGDRFPHHMPKYYSDKIYGTKNPFSIEKENYLFRMAAVDDARQLAELQANGCRSLGEAYHQKAMRESEDLLQRSRIARDQFINIYSRSRL